MPASEQVLARVARLRQEVRELEEAHGIPRPRFGVSYRLAHAFGGLMEWLGDLLGREPFLTRGIVHLLRETHADGALAADQLGFHPTVQWRDAVDGQMAEIRRRSGATA